MVRSAALEILFTAFFAHAFLTCHKHKKILACGHTRLQKSHNIWWGQMEEVVKDVRNDLTIHI